MMPTIRAQGENDDNIWQVSNNRTQSMKTVRITLVNMEARFRRSIQLSPGKGEKERTKGRKVATEQGDRQTDRPDQ